MKQKTNRSFDLQILVRVAILVAMTVLLMNYLGIHTQFFKIGFSFVPIALCGMMYGARWSAACAVVGDLINCLLGPFGWYPPLTLSAGVNGALYGLLLKGRSDSLPAILAAAALSQLLIGLVVTTWLLSMLYTAPYFELMVTRLPQVLVMLPVQAAVLRLIGEKRVVAALSRAAQ